VIADRFHLKRLRSTTLLAILTMSVHAHALDVQGHRGARGLLPENTLAAFARALELDVTTVELDCGVTKDGIVVIAHDRTLNPDFTRDASGRWIESAPAIAHLTYAELSAYDVGRIRPGSGYAQRFPRQQSIDGTRVPRLADLFALVRARGNERVRFNIETKISPLAPGETFSPEAFAEALLHAITAAKLDSRVTIQSFDWRTLQVVQKRAPHIPTVYLTAEQGSPDNIPASGPSQWTAGLQLSAHGGSLPRTIKAAGGAVWSPDYRDLTFERLHEARQLGLRVVVWTVNGERDMRRLVEWGVDGIISDYPDVLLRVARDMNARN
jgi:glycerophosphoryl diester phosphodiesterase